jgi:uncharacterized repeat protein (TIGR03803 family)
MRKRTACIVLLLCAVSVSASARTYTTLHIFEDSDGATPEGLVQATDGSLYGTTEVGGDLTQCYGSGCGTVFSINTGGTLATLDDFEPAQGEYPIGLPMAQAANGDLHGALAEGGASTGQCLYGYGCGAIYKITLDGALSVVYSFCSQSNCADGGGPTSLVRATDGSFYSTTASGGANCVATGGCGTFFKIAPDGTLTTLYSFCSLSECADGSDPGVIVQALDGNFYGTTYSGGAYNHGTVFKITPGGALTTLYSFCQQSSCPDGSIPAALIQATNGDFYGSTYEGGTANAGTIYRITPTGTLITVHSFSFDGTDGSFPFTTPIQASDGNFYGTTSFDGVGGGGTIYKLSPSGAFTTLHSFCFHLICATAGSFPYGLLQDTNGDFYGSTERGGNGTGVGPYCSNGCGTMYSFSIGLKPFVETQLASGKVGASVTILGTNLAGATGVSFNGTEATIIAKSGSAIETTVPAGATSGYITVRGDGSTLKSNKPFHVIQ